MKKRIVIITLGLLLAGAVQAQVFLQEGDDNNLRDVTVPVDAWPDNPIYSQGNDNTPYTPLGSGIALLAALGGAYLLGKKRNKFEKR